MLILISDLHLTDCSTATNPHATAFKLLTEELKASIKAKEAKEIHVVLLGDVFDLVRTDHWHANAIPAKKRPWGGDKLDPRTGMNPDPDVERQFGEVLAKILDQTSSKALIEGLKSLGGGGGPPVRVTCVVGNHDRVLNNFASLREQIAREFAPLPIDFPNFFHSSEYRVLGRHGHEWDEHCHAWKFLTKVLQPGSKAGRFDPETYRVMGIGEVITAELMSGFVFNVRHELPDDPEFHRLAMEINNLRPMSDVIRWITWLTQRDVVQERFDACIRAFRKALEDTLDTTLAKEWDRVKADVVVSGDITDFLAKALAILKTGRGLQVLQKLVAVIEKFESVVEKVRGHREDDLYHGAKDEYGQGTVPDDVDYILYGHTHGARQVCFSAEVEGRARMYVNTGTFLPLIERTADRQSFFRSNRMTFICIYRSDEDTAGRHGPGPTLDVWDGMKRKEYLPD